MANKRQVKKAIYNACGEMAMQCLIAQEMLSNEPTFEQWDQVLVDIAALQSAAIARVRRGFNKAQARELTDFFTTRAQEIAGKMNALMPKKA